MSEAVVVTDGGEQEAPVEVNTAVIAPDDKHDVYQMILETQRDIRALHESHAAHTNEKIAELCAKLEMLEARVNEQKAPSEEAREEALEDIADVGEVLSDLAESVIPASGVDNIVTELQAPVTVSSQNDSGVEGETIVEPDIGTAGTNEPPANASRRSQRRRIAGIPW